MIEQQKVKLREERESVTRRFKVVLYNGQMASTLCGNSSMYLPFLSRESNISLEMSHRSSASPAFPTCFQQAAGSSTSSDALPPAAQVELTRRSLPRQTKKAEKEDDEKDLGALGQGNWNFCG